MESKQKQICYIGYTPTYSGSPDQSMAMEYIGKTADCHIDYYCWGINCENIFSNPDAFTFYYTKGNNIIAALKFFINIARNILFNKKYDVIYVQGAQLTPFVFWVPVIPFRKYKTVFHSQDFIEHNNRFYYFFERLFCRNVDTVIWNEPNRARFVASDYELKQMPIIIRTALPSYFNFPEFSHNYRNLILKKAGVDIIQGNIMQYRIIFAGGAYRKTRMSPQLLDAFYSLPDNYILVFTGAIDNNNQVACDKHLKQIGKSDRIAFFPRLPFADLLNIMAASDIGILLYPNSCIGHYYQCPGRLGQYLRCGLRIVTVDYPNMELLVLKYQLGAVANPLDPQSIANAILSIGEITKEELSNQRSKMIELGKTTFAYENQGQKLFNILNLTPKGMN